MDRQPARLNFVTRVTKLPIKPLGEGFFFPTRRGIGSAAGLEFEKGRQHLRLVVTVGPAKRRRQECADPDFQPLIRQPVFLLVGGCRLPSGMFTMPSQSAIGRHSAVRAWNCSFSFLLVAHGLIPNALRE